MKPGDGYAPGYTPLKAWWAVLVIMLFQIVSLIDRTVIAVLIPEMRAELGLNDFQLSLIQGMAFALFYGAMGLVIGGLVDRWSRRGIMFAGITIWSLAAAATGLARDYAQLFGARLLVGFGEGAISPAAQSLLAGIFPRRLLATPMSCFVAAGVAGIGLSFALGGFLLDHFTHSPLGGPLEGLAPWRQVMVVTGIPGVLVGLLAFSFKEPVRAVVGGGGATWKAFFAHLRLHARLMGGLMGGFLLSAMATQGAMIWTPTYARRVLDMGATEVGGMMGLAVTVGGIVGSLAMGQIVDRLYARGVRDAAIRLYFWMLAVAPPLVAVTYLVGSAQLLFAGVLVLMLTVGASFGPALTAVQMVSPPAMRGRFGALAVLVSNLGGLALGPMLVGGLTDYVFADPDRIGWSIIISLTGLGAAAAAVIGWARPAYSEKVREG